MGRAGEIDSVSRGDAGTSLTSCLPAWLLRVKVLPAKVVAAFAQQSNILGHPGTRSEQQEGKVIFVAALQIDGKEEAGEVRQEEDAIAELR